MSSRSDRLYTITELARELGVTARAIRFYESKGLLAPQRAGNNRVYTYRERARLQIILRGKRLGFTLRGIKEYLDLYDADHGRGIGQLEHLLRGARQRTAELERQRHDLELTLSELREVEAQTLAALREARARRAGRAGGRAPDTHDSPPEPDELPAAAAAGPTELSSGFSSQSSRRRQRA
jgi:DNA-binding transcriptional MerR regulator